jgi:hypothetical protein
MDFKAARKAAGLILAQAAEMSGYSFGQESTGDDQRFFYNFRTPHFECSARTRPAGFRVVPPSTAPVAADPPLRPCHHFVAFVSWLPVYDKYAMWVGWFTGRIHLKFTYWNFNMCFDGRQKKRLKICIGVFDEQTYLHF